jgi:uncharacterized protein DUF4242
MIVRACPLTLIRPEGRRTMPKYVIERDIPGAGKLSTFELRSISQRSCAVLERLGPKIQWVQSYVTDDRIYCVYIAPDEEIVREHAKQGRFPATRISRVRTVIDPTTAE